MTEKFWPPKGKTFPSWIHGVSVYSVSRGFHIGRRAVVFWTDVKNSTIGFNRDFMQSVSLDAASTPCNVEWCFVIGQCHGNSIFWTLALTQRSVKRHCINSPMLDLHFDADVKK